MGTRKIGPGCLMILAGGGVVVMAIVVLVTVVGVLVWAMRNFN